MANTADFDQVAKAITNLAGDWGRTLQKIDKDLERVQAILESISDLTKQKANLLKAVDKATDDLAGKIKKLKILPSADKQQIAKIQDLFKKAIEKNAGNLPNYGRLDADMSIDTEKPDIKNAKLHWSWNEHGWHYSKHG
jgi:uncharacterized protein YoxC